jgi:hypothetical protein
LPGKKFHRGGGNAVHTAMLEDALARIEGKEIQAVDVQVDAVQEGGHIAGVDAGAKHFDVELGIDVARHARRHLGLGQAQGRHERGGLAVEVGDIEGIEIGNAEGADPEARQRQQVDAAHPAHAGNGNALAAEQCLFFGGDPADIARECLLIGERGGHGPLTGDSSSAG